MDGWISFMIGCFGHFFTRSDLPSCCPCCFFLILGFSLNRIYPSYIHTSFSIAFKPAESGWGATSKYSKNFGEIFGKNSKKVHDTYLAQSKHGKEGEIEGPPKVSGNDHAKGNGNQ